jgi:putative transposase
MKQNKFHGLNKSIGDAAWRMFLDLLDCKAEEAGKRVIKVNPAYTSQTCSKCGTRHKLTLSDRIFHCPVCDLELSRDVNAAINILGLGLQSIGYAIEAPGFSRGE